MTSYYGNHRIFGTHTYFKGRRLSLLEINNNQDRLQNRLLGCEVAFYTENHSQVRE